jgi:hypothetical protein
VRHENATEPQANHGSSEPGKTVRSTNQRICETMYLRTMAASPGMLWHGAVMTWSSRAITHHPYIY